MRKLLFFVFLLAGIAGSLYILLFVDAFFIYNGSYQIGGTTYSGYARLGNLFRNITSFRFGTTPYHFLTYAKVLFLIVCSTLIIRLILRFIFTLGTLGKASRVYRKSIWFLLACMVLSCAYVWYVANATSAEDATGFSLRTLPIWFYLPIVAAIICTAMAGAFQDFDQRDV